MSATVTRRAALLSALALSALASPIRSARAAGAARPLKVGVTPGAYADSVIAAAADAKARGLDVEAVEFSDWTTPNLALDSGDIDVNYFQHRPFLDNAIKERGYRFTDVGVGTLANIGLYSLKHKSFAEIPDRGSVAGFRSGDAWLGGGTWLFSEPQPGLTRLLDLGGFGWAPLAVDGEGLTIAATCTVARLARWTAPPS